MIQRETFEEWLSTQKILSLEAKIHQTGYVVNQTTFLDQS